jgi:LCP family protein required for cell wall assembly
MTGTLPETQADEDVPRQAEEAPVKRPGRRWARILLLCFIAMVVLGTATAFVGWKYLRSVEGKVERTDVFEAVPEASRPPKPPSAAMNLLILGSDSRNPDITGSRTDTIMLAHVTADHSAAQIVSIPRDTWLDIPRTADGRGGVKAKINAAFAWGGIALMVRTVEDFTRVRIDHVVVIDFAGFEDVVNTLGGIDITIDDSFTSIHPPHRHFAAGRQHLDGAEALDYSRQRKQFKNGDFSRIQHQQQVIRAILAKATTAGILADPGALNRFLTATAHSVTVDRSFDLLSTALEVRGIEASRIRFITNPSTGTGREGNQSVVYADRTAAAALYAAVRADTAAAWKAP